MELVYQIREQLRAKYYTTERLLENYVSSLKGRIPESNCEILDVGCGQSEDILDLIHRDYRFTAVDSDIVPLVEFKHRVEQMNPDYINKIKFVQDEFPSSKLQYEKYDAIIFHNILHFFTLEKLIDIFKNINSKFKPGAVISIIVHSHKHEYNIESNTHRYDFFKHYFEFDDLRKIFPPEQFTTEMECDFVMTKTLSEIEFSKMVWRQILIEIHGVTDEFAIKRHIDASLQKLEKRNHILQYMVTRK